MQRQIGLWLVCCFFAASLGDRRVGAEVAPGSKGPLSLQPFTQDESKSGLLFLLQLIGPDCYSDQQELPHHLTRALSELLDTVKPESIGLLNFSSPNGQLSEPERTLLQGNVLPEEEEPLISASWSQPRSRFLADEQPHHGHHSALRKLLQGMNSQEPALMFLYAAEPQHDHEAVHLQLSDMVASGRLGDAIRAAVFKLSDIHLVAFEPVFGDHMSHEGISDMMHFGEHGPGPLSGSMSHNHHRHLRHKSHTEMLAGVITFVAVFHVVKRCCKRLRKQKSTVLSQLSAQSDTMPNPLLPGRHNLATGPMQAAGVIPISDPDWIANVPWSDWQIDQQDITLCQRPDGRLWELGAGASAKVYRALKSGVQVVAAKVFQDREPNSSGSLLPSSRASTVRLDVFKQEIAILKSCHDRNIVQFIGACLQPDCTIMVMEYLEGGDLYHAIANDSTGRFSWYRRDPVTGAKRPGLGRRIALDTARGLHFLHSRKIVHFDLKSANILLSRDFTAKIADVGLAKIMQQQFLSTLYCIGTFAWAAPEVLLGKSGCTEKVDMYSYGVVLWELCTGQSPTGRQLRPVKVPEECPQEVADVIASCLDENPTNRPTARQIVDQLGALRETKGSH
ncbi:hypothetical protein WJX77_000324 [Trebouxia sp. C0004]